MIQTDFFVEALADNAAAFSINAAALIRKQMPGHAVGVCHELELEEFQRLGHCQLTPLAEPIPEVIRFWGGEENDELFSTFEQVVWEVRWSDQLLHVIQLQWDTNCGRTQRFFVVGSTEVSAKALILDIARKTHAPGESILVFSSGHWSRNRSLYRLVQSASFDDLILSTEFKDELRQDFLRFLSSEDQYRRLGIAWKRGALLIGPPGNGKTHFVRALIREMGIAVLYVQSLSHHHYTPEQMWHQVFQQARGLSPCVLVLEDLDALVRPENRSFFLNQLDGLQQNHGLVLNQAYSEREKVE